MYNIGSLFFNCKEQSLLIIVHIKCGKVAIARYIDNELYIFFVAISLCAAKGLTVTLNLVVQHITNMTQPQADAPKDKVAEENPSKKTHFDDQVCDCRVF